MELKDFETEINDEIYRELAKTFVRLRELANAEKSVFALSEREALELAQQAFERYLEAELIYQAILVHPVRGAALDNIQRYIQQTICQQRIEKMRESIEYHGFA
jgi:hypothetical protein